MSMIPRLDPKAPKTVPVYRIRGGYDDEPRADTEQLWTFGSIPAANIGGFEQFVSNLAAFKPQDIASSSAWTERIANVLANIPKWYQALDPKLREDLTVDQLRRYAEARLLPTLVEGLSTGDRMEMALRGGITVTEAFDQSLHQMGTSDATREMLVKIFKDQIQSNPGMISYFQRKNVDLMQDAIQGVGIQQQHNVLQRAYQGVKEVFDFDRDVLHQRYKLRRNEAYRQKKGLEKATSKVSTVFKVDSNNTSYVLNGFFVEGYSVYVRAKNGANVNYSLDANIDERSIAFGMSTVQEGNVVIKVNNTDLNIQFEKKQINLFTHKKFDEARGVAFKPRAYPYVLKRVGQQLFHTVFAQKLTENQAQTILEPTDRVDWERPYSLQLVAPPQLRISFIGYQPGEEFVITYYRFDSSRFDQAITTSIRGETLAQKYYYALHLVNQANYQYEKIKQKLAVTRKYKLLRNDEKLMRGVMQYWGFQTPAKGNREVRRGNAAENVAVRRVVEG